jgi:hypothetical protein
VFACLVCLAPHRHYRKMVVAAMPQLNHLDDMPVRDKDHRLAAAFLKVWCSMPAGNTGKVKGFLSTRPTPMSCPVLSLCTLPCHVCCRLSPVCHLQLVADGGPPCTCTPSCTVALWRVQGGVEAERAERDALRREEDDLRAYHQSRFDQMVAAARAAPPEPHDPMRFRAYPPGRDKPPTLEPPVTTFTHKLQGAQASCLACKRDSVLPAAQGLKCVGCWWDWSCNCRSQ